MTSNSIGNLIAVLFLSREITHREHLKTKSYAQHMALGSFYEEIIGLADSLAETYQGRVGRIEDIPYLGGTSGDIVEILKRLLSKVEEGRKECCPEDSTIQNIIDEIIALYLSTIFKLTFLK